MVTVGEIASRRRFKNGKKRVLSFNRKKRLATKGKRSFASHDQTWKMRWAILIFSRFLEAVNSLRSIYIFIKTFWRKFYLEKIGTRKKISLIKSTKNTIINKRKIKIVRIIIYETMKNLNIHNIKFLFVLKSHKRRENWTHQVEKYYSGCHVFFALRQRAYAFVGPKSKAKIISGVS